MLTKQASFQISLNIWLYLSTAFSRVILFSTRARAFEAVRYRPEWFKALTKSPAIHLRSP